MGILDLFRKKVKVIEPAPVETPDKLADLSEEEIQKHIQENVFGLVALAIAFIVIPIVMEAVETSDKIGEFFGVRRRTIANHWTPAPKKLIKDSQYYPAMIPNRLAYATSYKGIHYDGARKVHRG